MRENGQFSQVQWNLVSSKCKGPGFFLRTLASTNIDQSNLFKMYVTIRLRMSSIMDLIRPELFELSALELENFPYLTFFTL